MCVFITVLGWYQWQYMRHLEENILRYQPIAFFKKSHFESIYSTLNNLLRPDSDPDPDHLWRGSCHLYYNCRSQFLLDCLGRCLKLSVSTDGTSSHEVASHFGLAIFVYAKNTQKLSRRPSPAQVFVECASHGRSIAIDNMSGNNSDHIGERLNQNGDNESLYLHDLTNVV